MAAQRGIDLDEDNIFSSFETFDETLNIDEVGENAEKCLKNIEESKKFFDAKLDLAQKQFLDYCKTNKDYKKTVKLCNNITRVINMIDKVKKNFKLWYKDYYKIFNELVVKINEYKSKIDEAKYLKVDHNVRDIGIPGLLNSPYESARNKMRSWRLFKKLKISIDKIILNIKKLNQNLNSRYTPYITKGKFTHNKKIHDLTEIFDEINNLYEYDSNMPLFRAREYFASFATEGNVNATVGIPPVQLRNINSNLNQTNFENLFHQRRNTHTRPATATTTAAAAAAKTTSSTTSSAIINLTDC